MSHVIRYSDRSEESTNRGISTTILQTLKEDLGNYVRNFGDAGVSAAETKTRQEPGTTTETGRGRGGQYATRPGRAACNEAGAEREHASRAETSDEAGAVHTGRGEGHTCARSVTSAFVSSTRSRGLSSTLRPRRPPETIMVSWSRHAESMNNRCEVVCPSGLMPPTT